MKAFRLALLCPLLAATCWAQGTRTWEQTKYDEFEKGSAHGVACKGKCILLLGHTVSGRAPFSPGRSDEQFQRVAAGEFLIRREAGDIRPCHCRLD